MTEKLCFLITVASCASLLLAGCGLMPTEVPSGGEAADLEGTRWTLDSYRTSEGEFVGLLPNTEITLTFESGEVRGSAGCNNYFGSYELEGDGLSIGPLASTEMYCAPDELMDQEGAYLVALQGAASYQIADRQLRIANAEGEKVLAFSVAVPTPLTGTTWLMTFYYDGKGAVVSALLGTEITAVFGEDGSAAGSAGCNNYTASYEVDGERITVGPAATTRMMCAEPEGIMVQEIAYLAALESAASYAIEGDQLELMDAEGRRAVSYVVAPEKSPGLTEDTLKNAAYRGIYEETVQLTDGRYEGEPFVEGGASRPTVTFIDPCAFGDLDSDGVEDAAALLAENSGGSGTFIYLAAVLNRNGNPQSMATTPLGDGVQVKSLSIEGGEIVVAMITHGPDDPMCCPTQQVVQTYELRDGELVQTSEEVISAASDSEIVGVVWKWVKFLGGDDTTIIVDDPDKYTLELLPDGQVRIQADCNSASGTYTMDGAGGLTLELGPTTLAECEPGSLYDKYLEMLGWVRTYVMEGDQLVLNMMADGGDLFFDKETPPAAAGPEMVGVVWEWVKFLGGDGTTIIVEEPEKYTLELLPDGQVRAQADCNSASGTYTSDAAGGLALELGATTLAQCPPDSLSDDYLEMLSYVRTYVLEGDQLALNMMADGGDLFFEGEGVSAAAGPEIVGVLWEWVKFLGGDGATIIVEEPEKYTLELLPDGQARIHADCNSASGTYTLDAAGGLTLELGPTTLAECEPGSLYDEYLEMLGWVRTYVFDGDQLVLNMMADGGDLFFQKAGSI